MWFDREQNQNRIILLAISLLLGCSFFVSVSWFAKGSEFRAAKYFASATWAYMSTEADVSGNYYRRLTCTAGEEKPHWKNWDREFLSSVQGPHNLRISFQWYVPRILEKHLTQKTPFSENYLSRFFCNNKELQKNLGCAERPSYFYFYLRRIPNLVKTYQLDCQTMTVHRQDSLHQEEEN